MRYSAFTWFAVAGVLAAAAIGACSNDIITTASGGTSSGASSSSGAVAGAGGNVAGTTAVTTSTGNTSVASSSGGIGGASGTGGATGTGGGTPCDQVCAKIDACKSFVNCTLIEQYAGFQFDCSSDQQVCLGNCLDPQINCMSLFTLGGAVQTCMKMCGINTGAGATGSSSGGGGAVSSSASSSAGSSSGNVQAGCNGCVQKDCAMQLQSCAFDFKTGCGKWVGCLQGAMSPQDVDTCNMNNPAAAAAHQDVITCACSSCAAECPLTEPCGVQDSDAGVPEGGVLFDGGH